MYHYISLLFVYILKVIIILLWHNVRFNQKLCNNNWLYSTCNYETAQCGDSISVHHYITLSKYLLVQEELKKTISPTGFYRLRNTF